MVAREFKCCDALQWGSCYLRCYIVLVIGGECGGFIYLYLILMVFVENVHGVKAFNMWTFHGYCRIGAGHGLTQPNFQHFPLIHNCRHIHKDRFL